MLKKLISLLVLLLYMHGMSGYTMSFHTCTITGFQNVYTGFGNNDPCQEEEDPCRQTSDHFDRADCCEMENTIVNVDDDSNISNFKISFFTSFVTSFIQVVYQPATTHILHPHSGLQTLRPPDLNHLCILRI